jgi:pSer/pThr/pTyr-binding forkhead associated (FHA) protein
MSGVRRKGDGSMAEFDAASGTGRLEILNGGFEGMTYDLNTEEVVIGRNPTTDITLLDEGISREHAVILYDADAPGYVIEDLQSTNGTKVNGKRIRSAPLVEGDEIQIGQTLFRFVLTKA